MRTSASQTAHAEAPLALCTLSPRLAIDDNVRGECKARLIVVWTPAASNGRTCRADHCRGRQSLRKCCRGAAEDPEVPSPSASACERRASKCSAEWLVQRGFRCHQRLRLGYWHGIEGFSIKIQAFASAGHICWFAGVSWPFGVLFSAHIQKCQLVCK